MVLVSPTWAPFSLITRIVTLPGLLASLVTRGHSRNGCAYKITRPFPAKAYILLLLFYHNWPQSTTSLLLSCEKVTQKHFHTAAPLWRQYESAFARSRGFFSINLCFTIYNFFIKLCRNFYIIVIRLLIEDRDSIVQAIQA